MPICECCQETVKNRDKHHIISTSKGGTNDKSNITKICPNCHRSVHAGDIIIEGIFMTTKGRVLLWHDKDGTPITTMKPDCYTWSK